MLNKYWGLLASLLLLSSVSLPAQTIDFDDYKPLRSQGELPDYLYKNVQEQLAALDEEANEAFYKESSYFISNVLRSGQVLFNDPVSAYLNDIVDVLLKDEPKLRKKIRVHAVRSAVVNAFATDQGYIFVNIGLLAQVENEAQLAFILAHEIIHTQKKHNEELFVFREENNDKNVWKNGLEQRIFQQNNYSKEMESEADEDGFELYAKSPYALSEVDGVFDVLRYGFLPFDDVAFELSFLSNDNFSFPKSYYLTKLKVAEGIDEEQDDSRSTHPNIGKRRRKIATLSSKRKDKGKAFALSEKRFDKLQKLARFEMPFIHLQSKDTRTALYELFLLRRKYPESTYLDKLMAKALYLHAYMENRGEAYIIDLDDVEGEIQRLIHLLNELKVEEITVIAADYVWRASKRYSDDRDLKEMAAHLFYMLNDAEGYNSLSDYYDQSMQERYADAAKDTVAQDSINKEELTKYERLRLKQKNQVVDSSQFVLFTFADLLEDEDFQKMFETFKEAAEDTKSGQENDNVNSIYISGKSYETERDRRKGLRLGLDRVVCMPPIYLKAGIENKRMKLENEDSYTSKLRIQQELLENAESLGLDAELFALTQLQQNDVERFNEIGQLNEWFSLQSSVATSVIAPNQDAIRAIADKYATPYFLWSGVISIGKRTLVFGILYNVKTGQQQVVKFLEVSRRDSKVLVHGHLYDMLKRIVAEPKDKS